jgi:hypothetical protein
MNNRRKKVPFDPYFFGEREKEGLVLSTREIFREIFETNHWSGPESVSGEGASLEQVRVVMEKLPRLLEMLRVEVLLDLPCGDFGWMRHVDLSGIRYIGADIVPELIEANNNAYANPERTFVELDLMMDPLPEADLLLCRDGLVHLSLDDVGRAILNIRRSGIAYLLATTFPDCEYNEDITTGDWRPLNLCEAPFYFPKPLLLINEGCTEGGGAFADKSLGLWRTIDLPRPVRPG